MSKDWIGNANSTFRIIGASNHSNYDREENDYYATDPIAIDKLLQVETFNTNIWECACGEKHLSNALIKYGYNVLSTDLINRDGNTKIIDFLSYNGTFNGDIITNPPYKYAREFVLKALEVIKPNNRVAFLLKLTFLEGKKRYMDIFKNHNLKTVYVSTNRINCARNGNFKQFSNKSAVCYAWFIFQKGYNGDANIKWFNF